MYKKKKQEFILIGKRFGFDEEYFEAVEKWYKRCLKYHSYVSEYSDNYTISSTCGVCVVYVGSRKYYIGYNNLPCYFNFTLVGNVNVLRYHGMSVCVFYDEVRFHWEDKELL